MKNKLLLKSITIILTACIILSNLSVLTGATSTSTTSPTVYEYIASEEYDSNGDLLYNGYLNVSEPNITINPGHSLKTFAESMTSLSNELTDGKTGVSSTQVSFNNTNTNDQAEHTLNVQVDFAGKVLSLPLNVMFIMDQSGSLNMFTNTISTTATAPDMNPNHYYKTAVTLTYTDGTEGTYDYYHSPFLSGATGAWYFASTSDSMLNYAKNGAESSNLVLPGLSGSYVSISTGEIVKDAPVDVANYKQIKDVSVITPNSKTPIFTSTQTLSPLECTFPAGSTAENTVGFPFELYELSMTPDDNWQYYSPELFTREHFYFNEGEYNNFDSEAYINNMLANNRAYDRMLLSKILFKDLSNTIVSNSASLSPEEQNKIGYVQFAGLVDTTGTLDTGIDTQNYYIAGNRELQTSYFDDTFTRTQGFYQTNYYKGFEKAKEFFATEKNEYPDRDAKNLVIFVSDGAPSQPTTPVNYTKSSTFRSLYMNNFVAETNSIVYFAGINLSNVDYNNWSAAIATQDSESTDLNPKYLSSNGNTLSELIDIRNQIEKLVNAAAYITADIDPLFELRVDENHPIEFTYATTSEPTPNTIPFKNMPTPGEEQILTGSSGVEIGTILYDETNKTLTWKITHPNVVNARMSFYEQLDETEIDWADIAKGNTQTAEVLTASTVDFIDENGINKTLLMEDQGSVTISGNSQLRIENISTPQSGVEVPNNSIIDYEITVTNESITTSNPVDAENVLVVQAVPRNTTYVSHTDATITGSGTAYTLTGDYDIGDNEIRFVIPILKANETFTFNYKAKVTSEYDKTIISVSQLGISDKPDTLDKDAYPLLHALNLVHTTPNRPTGGVTDPTTPPTTSTATPAPTAGTILPPILSVTPSPSVEPTPSPSAGPTPEPSEEPSSIPLPPDNNGTDGDVIEPDKVEVGEDELTENDYTIGDDGTITINPDYIATLPDGEYVIRVTGEDGDVYESVIIVESGVPLSATPFEYVGGAAWSLFDLLSTIFVALTVIHIAFIKRRKTSDKAEEDWDQFDRKYNEIEDTRFAKLRKRKVIALAIEALMTTILLLITQDFTLPMTIFDQYSIAFALCVILSIIIVITANKKPIDDDEEKSISQKIEEYEEEIENDKQKLLRGKTAAIIIDLLLIIALFIITQYGAASWFTFGIFSFTFVFVLCAILIVAIIPISNKIDEGKSSKIKYRS